MKRFFYLAVISVVFALGSSAVAQDDLSIFGFFQSRLEYSNVKNTFTLEIPGMEQTTEDVSKTLSPGVQQLNVFMMKELADDYSAWVNFEMVNSFSTERGWGEFNLEEAWVKYRKNRGFSLKAGYLIPVFNNLNEVKNRMPYLPYIMRPLVYEASMSGVVDISDFLPERAFLQAYGAAPAGKANVEYAVFIGPGERSLFASKNDPAGTGTPGADTTTFVEVGGRLGVKVAGLKAGVSGTLDKDNQQQMLGEHVQRVRFGSDFSGTINKIFFEAEVILVKEDPKADVDLDKTFWYGTLGYQLANGVFVYGMYSYVKDANSPYFGEGINAVFGGVNCQLTNGLLLKAQGLKFMSNDTHFSVPVEGLGLVPAYTNISGYFLSTALSVSF